jgi:divalent metal cation (Fe/Co/Zn/Cd) transporter
VITSGKDFRAPPPPDASATAGELQKLREVIAKNDSQVAAKIALTPGLPVEDVARAIDDAEARVRAAVPAARMIYLEPDLERTVRR